jgi:hypothetical protein
MLHLALGLFVITLAVVINVSALRAGEDQSGWIHYTACASGALGIFFMLCIPISLIYALASYFLDPSRDTSFLFDATWISAIVCTLSSAALCLVLWRRDSRLQAR